jgi:hypothetical protein
MIEPRSEYDYGTAAIELAYYTPAPQPERVPEWAEGSSYVRKLAILDRNHARYLAEDGVAVYKRDMVKAMRDTFKTCPVYFRTMLTLI